MVGCELVRTSSFQFTSDLLPSARNHYPSGVLHAFRTTTTSINTSTSATSTTSTSHASVNNDNNNNNNNDDNTNTNNNLLPCQSSLHSNNLKEEHIFAWIANRAHIPTALSHFETSGFTKDRVCFLPYSSKANWFHRYPHAAPALEYNEEGRSVTVGLLGMLGLEDSSSSSSSTATLNADFLSAVTKKATAATENRTSNSFNIRDGPPNNTPKEKKKKCRRKAYIKQRNLFDDDTLIPDAERDELHIEIYNYFSWLYDKLKELERREEEVRIAAAEAEAEAAAEAHAEAKAAAVIAAETGAEAEIETTGAEIEAEIDESEFGAELEGELEAEAELDDVIPINNVDDGWLDATEKKKSMEKIKATTHTKDQDQNQDQDEMIDQEITEEMRLRTTRKVNLAMEKTDAKKSASSASASRKAGRPKGTDRIVDLADLKTVLDRMEFAFSVIPSFKAESLEEAAKSQLAEAGSGEMEEGGINMDGEQEKLEGVDSPSRTQTQPISTTITATTEIPQQQHKGATLLELELAPSLRHMVKSRQVDGKPLRRRRKRKRKTKADIIGYERNKTKYKKKMNEVRVANEIKEVEGKFDEMEERLARYKEEHGDCSVSCSCEDVELYKFVKNMREKRARLRRNGSGDGEVLAKGKHISLRTLTAERIERLDAIGFAWIIGSTKETWISWEERFQHVMEYYEENGKWPTQTMGGLGMWVHKQRQSYARKDERYMKKRAPLLDEVGFEWTPRGYTRMSWEDGFDLLMEFGRINGHFEVPANANEEDGEPIDRKSDAYRLHRWVESLHSMYRSYKLGRQSGSLNDERVLLLIKHGFVFRNC